MSDEEVAYGKWELLNDQLKEIYLLRIPDKGAFMFYYVQPPVESKSMYTLTDYDATEGAIFFYPKERSMTLVGNTSNIFNNLEEIRKAPGLPSELTLGLESLLIPLKAIAD